MAAGDGVSSKRFYADIPVSSRESRGGRSVAIKIRRHGQSEASGKPRTALYRDWLHWFSAFAVRPELVVPALLASLGNPNHR